MTERALDRQVDGGHYVKLKIQPIEVAMANRLDACGFSILKYITRHRDKGGRKDVDKAMASLKKTGDIESPVRCKWAPKA